MSIIDEDIKKKNQTNELSLRFIKIHDIIL